MAESTDVAKSIPVYDDETLAGIHSWDDAMRVIADAGITATEIKEYGDGFEVMEKDEFENVPFVILDYKFSESKEGYTDDAGNPATFAIFRIIAKDGRKAILTDGGSGICNKLRELEERGVVGGVVCPKGITVSRYKYVDRSNGNKETPAKTYYLSQ